MIIRHIVRRHGGAGYQRLAGYVLNVAPQHRSADPARWTQLNAYTLATERAGEKVAWERATNCQGDDPGWAVKEILATQARNTRSRTDKTYHLVVSFPDSEQPSRTQVEDIEDRLCAAIGLAEHQRVSAVHQNTDNWHLHVAINTVHPRSFRMRCMPWSHYRLQAAAVELEIRHGLRRGRHTTAPQGLADKPKIKGRAADFEARQGQPSFLRWVREMATPALLAARDGDHGWPGLHTTAARFDLEIRPQGAGLVIGHRTAARLFLKASHVDRRLSFKAVTDVLGPFQPPGQGTSVRPTESYAMQAPSGPLYEAFKQARIVAVAARAAALAKLREQHLDDAGRRASASRVRAQHPIPTWQRYLETEASNGNEAALALLRDRLPYRPQTDGQRLQAAEAGDARHIIHVHLRPTVRRDGRVIYRTADGGVVSDEARCICVKDVTAGAVRLALSLAMDRFGQRPLTVNGTDDFRGRVAAVAGIDGFNITFADDALNKQRASAQQARTTGTERDHGQALSGFPTPAITGWRGHDR